GELTLVAEACHARGEERKGAQEDQGEEGEEEAAERSLGERVQGADDAGAGEEGAEEGEAEGEDDEGEIPELQHAPPLLDHHGVEEGGGDEPRHKGGALHEIPRPVAAPAEHVIAPPAAGGGAHEGARP